MGLALSCACPFSFWLECLLFYVADSEKRFLPDFSRCDLLLMYRVDFGLPRATAVHEFPRLGDFS